MKNGLFGLFELLFSGESCWVASNEGSNKDKIALGSEISVEKQNFQGGMKAQVRLHENFMPAWNLIPPHLGKNEIHAGAGTSFVRCFVPACV